MRKIMVLFFISLLCLPAFTHAEPAKDALSGLKVLEAKVRLGKSYNDYEDAFDVAKSTFNIFLKSKDAEKFPKVTTSLKKIMEHYEFAKIFWYLKISTPDVPRTEFIRKDTNIGKSIAILYPKADLDRSMGGASYNDTDYEIDALLRVIWNEASRELDTATLLIYVKSGNEPPDETAKLKEEISKLKKENAMLKKENDRLRNPEKGREGY